VTKYRVETTAQNVTTAADIRHNNTRQLTLEHNMFEHNSNLITNSFCWAGLSCAMHRRIVHHKPNPNPRDVIWGGAFSPEFVGKNLLCISIKSHSRWCSNMTRNHFPKWWSWRN